MSESRVWSMKMPDTQCVRCGEKLNGTAVNSQDFVKPKDGDVSICAYCLEVQVFDGRGLREPSVEEYRKFLADDNLLTTLLMIRARHRQIGGFKRGGKA